MQYDYDANQSWACPGHQGGQMFMRHPAGRLFFEQMGESGLSRRHLQRDGVARRPADPRRPGARRRSRRRPGVRLGPDVFRPQRHVVVEQGGQHGAAPQQRHRAVRPQQPQVQPSWRAHHRQRHSDLPRDRPQRLRHGRARSTGRRSTRSTIRARIKAHPRLAGTDAWKKERPIRVAIIEQCTYDGTVYNARHDAREDRSPLRVHPLRRGLGRIRRVPSADEGPLRDGPRRWRRRTRA